jgi:hypothetical protein
VGRSGVDQLVIKFEARGVQLGTGQIAWISERIADLSPTNDPFELDPNLTCPQWISPLKPSATCIARCRAPCLDPSINATHVPFDRPIYWTCPQNPWTCPQNPQPICSVPNGYLTCRRWKRQPSDGRIFDLSPTDTLFQGVQLGTSNWGQVKSHGPLNG